MMIIHQTENMAMPGRIRTINISSPGFMPAEFNPHNFIRFFQGFRATRLHAGLRRTKPYLLCPVVIFHLVQNLVQCIDYDLLCLHPLIDK